MHYYTFHIADYRKDTAHLSPMEHYIYRQLIDWCYLDECAIPKKTQVVLRRLQLGTEHEALLTNVLSDFFEERENEWAHLRIEADIAEYHKKAAKNRVNGKKGGRPKKQRLTETDKPKKTQPVSSGNPSESEQKPNQEPITNNHKPLCVGETQKTDHKFAMSLDWRPAEAMLSDCCHLANFDRSKITPAVSAMFKNYHTGTGHHHSERQWITKLINWARREKGDPETPSTFERLTNKDWAQGLVDDDEPPPRAIGQDHD